MGRIDESVFLQIVRGVEFVEIENSVLSRIHSAKNGSPGCGRDGGNHRTELPRGTSGNQTSQIWEHTGFHPRRQKIKSGAIPPDEHTGSLLSHNTSFSMPATCDQLRLTG